MQTLLAVAGVGVPVALLLVLTGVSVGLATGPSADAGEIDYWVTPESGTGSAVIDAGDPRLAASHDVADRLAAREDVEYATPILLETLELRRPADGATEHVLVVGVIPEDGYETVAPLSTAALSPGDPHYADGSYEGPWTGEAVFSESAAEVFGVDTGASVEVAGRDRTLTVTAVESPRSAGLGQLPVVVVRLSEVQTLTGAASDDIATRLLVAAPDATADTETAIETAYPNTEVRSDDSILAERTLDSGLPAAMALAAFLLAMTTGILLVGTAFGFELAADGRQRAVLAAMGISARSRAALVGLEALWLALLGGAAGVLLWLGGSVLINELARRAYDVSVVALSPWFVAYGLAAAVCIGLVTVPYLLVVSRRTTTGVRIG